MGFVNLSIAARRTLLLASSALGCVAATPAFAQSPESGAHLGSVTVTDSAINESEAQTSYKVSRSTTATRTDTPLVDVPQAVNVVTVKQIEDQAANSIGDAIRYIPGVFSAQGEGNRETLVFRGNSTTGDFFVDGVRDDVQTYRDLYNIERLEIFKGPNAMIFGRGGIGGIANRVTKIANGENIRAFRLEAGRFDHYRGQFDVGQKISDAFSVRLTGVYQDSDSYRDGVEYKRWGLNPTATLKLSDATTITLGYEHFKDERVADRGVSTYLGKPLRTKRSTFFGDPEESPTWTNTDAATFRFEHKFSDTISIRNHTRYADYKKFYQNVFPGAVNTSAETVTPATTNRRGLAVGTYAPGSFVAISAYNQATKRENFISQTDLNAEFETGGIKHTLLVGFEYGRQITDNVRLEGRFSGSGFSGATSVYTPISQPRTSYPVNWIAISSSGNARGKATVVAGYIQDQIELSPMFQIVAGVRFEHYNTKLHDRRSLAFRTGASGVSPEFYDVTDKLWSPRVGLIFKPAESASIYASFSRTYQPRGGDQLAGLNQDNQTFEPEKFDNYEIGAKWDILPVFNVGIALFQLDRSNVIMPNANPAPGEPASVAAGRQRTKGVELSVAGNITEQLSMVGAYTYSDGKFRDNISGTVLAGNILPNMPKHSASLWTRFDPIDRLGVAAGIIHQGKRYAAQDNAVSMKGYTRVDAAVYFDINENLSAQLNVENVFNTRYFLYAHSNTNVTPGSPTSFKVGLNARF